MARRQSAGLGVFEILLSAVLAVVTIGAATMLGATITVKFAEQVNDTAVTSIKDKVLDIIDEPLVWVGILILLLIFLVFMRGMKQVR